VEFETTSVNPINETYIETSTVNNLTIIPPNATTTTTINATVTSNATVNILPNGLVLYQGQSLIVTEGMMVVQQNKRMLPLPLLTLVVQILMAQ
jgi:hypothetical protein